MSEPSSPTDERGRVEDPMSADRRTLVTAAVAMVGLVLVGVVGASIFTRSACEIIALEDVEAGPSGEDVEAVLDEALDSLGEADRERLLEGVAELAGPGGAVVAATDVGSVERFTDLGGDLTVVGETLSVLPALDAGTVDTVGFGGDATIVGDGASLYPLALINELTGQVDALAALEPDLAEQDCTDTATVGVPLAFHLDAADGQLLLFRVHDDGDGPELQLREPQGPVWDAEVTVGSGPPGVLAERLTARLGSELVVAARRSLEDETAPALAAHEIDGGDQRWAISPADLAPHVPAGEGALAPHVVGVEEHVVLVSLAREHEEEPEQEAVSALVGIDPADGSMLWTAEEELRGIPALLGSHDDELALLVSGGEGVELVALEPDSGVLGSLFSSSRPVSAAAQIGDRVLLGTEAGMIAVGPEREAATVSLPVQVADVAAHDEGWAILVRSEDGGAVLWVDPGRG